jgi:ADP-ribosylglycohydrolase
MEQSLKNRLLGLFMGQLVADAAGTRYEFGSKESVGNEVARDINSNGFLPILGEGPFRVRAGQYTDDSELALGIWDSILHTEKYDISDISAQFYAWFKSDPFDIGTTTISAFRNSNSYEKMKSNADKHNQKSLSNGCLMKISAIGSLNVLGLVDDLSLCAKEVCELTNPNPVCIDMCKAYISAIDVALQTGNPIMAYRKAKMVAELEITKQLLEDAATNNITTKLPDRNHKGEYIEVSADGQYQGYVGVAFQNAFYQLLHTDPAKNGFHTAILNTILLGGDTDTTACIAAALYGACHGISCIPEQWISSVSSFKNDESRIKTYPALDHMKLFDILICIDQ